MKKLLFIFLIAPLAAGAQCVATGTVYTANYVSPAAVIDDADGLATGSTSCGDGLNGTISLSTTSCTFLTGRGGHALRAYTNIPTVNNGIWTMDFKLDVTPTPGSGFLATNGPAVNLAILSSATSDLLTNCAIVGGNNCTACGSYAETNMDAIWVRLLSPGAYSCTDVSTGWYFQACARDGNGTPLVSASIPYVNGTNRYYIRLARTNGNMGMLSVYTDATFSTHVTGSPACFTIPGTVEDLDVLSHGIVSGGYCRRIFSGAISDLKIDNGNTCPTSLSPSFTASFNCFPTTYITVNGSASSASPVPIVYHYWEAVATDAAGNPMTTAWSQWGSGAPGTLSLPSSVYSWFATYPKIRIKLALQSCGNNWAEVTHVIFCNMTRMMNPDALNTAESFVIYPNPSSGSISIAGLQTEGIYTLNLYDLTGRLVSARQITVQPGSPTELALDAEAGVYVAEVISETGATAGMQRIVISR